MKTKYYLLISLTLMLVSCMDDFNPPANTYRENFETLWKIVDTRYCYLDYKTSTGTQFTQFMNPDLSMTL